MSDWKKPVKKQRTRFGSCVMMNDFVMRTEMIFWHMELLFVRRNAR